ncbi:MAG: flagellar hook-length control protein FliK [Stappiaceae bacterium]
MNVLAFLAGVLEGRSNGAAAAVSSSDGSGTQATFADILKGSSASAGGLEANQTGSAGVLDEVGLNTPVSQSGAPNDALQSFERSNTIVPFVPDGHVGTGTQEPAVSNNPLSLLLSLRDGLEAGEVTLDDLEEAFEQIKDVDQTGSSSGAPITSAQDQALQSVPAPPVPLSPAPLPQTNVGLPIKQGEATEPSVGAMRQDTGLSSVASLSDGDVPSSGKVQPSEANPTFFGSASAAVDRAAIDQTSDSSATPPSAGGTGAPGVPGTSVSDQDIVLPGPPDQHVLNGTTQPAPGSDQTNTPSVDGVGTGPVGNVDHGSGPSGPVVANQTVAQLPDGHVSVSGPGSQNGQPGTQAPDPSTQTPIPNAIAPNPDQPPVNAFKISDDVSGSVKAGTTDERGRPPISVAGSNLPSPDELVKTVAAETSRRPPAWIDAIIDAATENGASGDEIAIRTSVNKPEVGPVATSSAVTNDPLGIAKSVSFGRTTGEQPGLQIADEALQATEDGSAVKPANTAPTAPQLSGKPDAHVLAAQNGMISANLAEAATPLQQTDLDIPLPEAEEALVLQTAGRTDGQTVSAKPVVPGQSSSQPTVPMEAVGAHLAKMAQQKESRFEIRLHPSELGRIDVRLDINEQGEVRAHLIVERRETMDMLARDSRELQRALNEAGLSADQNSLNFSMKNQNGEGAADEKGEGNQFGQSGPSQENQSSEVPEAAARRAYVQSSDGMLDISI